MKNGAWMAVEAKDDELVIYQVEDVEEKYEVETKTLQPNRQVQRIFYPLTVFMKSGKRPRSRY